MLEAGGGDEYGLPRKLLEQVKKEGYDVLGVARVRQTLQENRNEFEFKNESKNNCLQIMFG
ncbi:hypothetical protein ACMG4P_21700 [Pseudovibrio denitrificans]|uniref:hypothetical protein n=1 Tax=Pseudovibrio denitrificans TaxID=258256 RepID=UPI0039BF8B85